MRLDWLQRLMEAYDIEVARHAVFREICARTRPS